MRKTITALFALAGFAAADLAWQYDFTEGEASRVAGTNAPTIDNLSSLSFGSNGLTMLGSNALTLSGDLGLAMNQEFSVALTLQSVTLGSGNNVTLFQMSKSDGFNIRAEVNATTGLLSVTSSNYNLNNSTAKESFNLSLSEDSMPQTVHFTMQNIEGGNDGLFSVWLDAEVAATFTVKGPYRNTAESIKFGAPGAEVASITAYNTYVKPTPMVPEPTTATLSLLALAGLAARRRRK